MIAARKSRILRNIVMASLLLVLTSWTGIGRGGLIINTPFFVDASIIRGLPDGFIAEVVANRPAITGLFAPNPRKNNKPMLLLVSKTGDVNVLEDPDNSDATTRILDLGNNELCFNGERGLQSLALHPNFEQNYLVYLFYNKFRAGCEQQTGSTPWNVVVQVPMNPNTLQLNMNAKKEIWRASKSHKAVHNGGAMIFGNDGYLYITTGDGGKSSNSQGLTNTHGCLIRLNDDGSVPSSNPFTPQNGYPKSQRCADNSNGEAADGFICSEIYANGLRNPFRIAVDPRETTKTLFSISDVGGSYWEEINYGGTDYAGKNYGYPVQEGVCKHGSAKQCPLPNEHNYQDPFHWYEHRSIENGGCVSGATFVPERLWPSKYKYLFADFVFNEVYKLIEDTDAEECRTCSPPTSRFRNETFFRTAKGPEDDSDDGARMTDMFFGPYKNTQALYVVFRGNAKTVLRFHWNGIKDNGLPIPVINLDDKNYAVDESIVFDGSSSTDPDGDDLEYAWDFGDGSTSTLQSPTHSYTESGEYNVLLVVTDAFGQEQETSQLVVVGSPPTASIALPVDGQEFFVGQVFTLQGSAFDAAGNRLDDSQLSWEVRQHHADHWHPFLDPTSGNNIEISPAPPPEDFFASTNSYLRVILTAADANGLTTEVSRLIQPTKVLVDIETNPQGLVMMVDYYPVETSDQIVSWVQHDLAVSVEDQPPYVFTSWSDGTLERERKVKVLEDGQVIQANFCAVDSAACTTNTECCSGQCSTAGTCIAPTAAITIAPTGETTSPTAIPSPVPTSEPTNKPSVSPTSDPTLPPSPSPTARPTLSPTSRPTEDPPLVTILSPLEGQTFHVGQLFNLVGFAVDRYGLVLPVRTLSWEMHLVSRTAASEDGTDVARQVDNGNDELIYQAIMNETQGNGVDSPPCPNPPNLLTAASSYIEISLEAADLTDGATARVVRTLKPEFASLHLYTNPEGLQILVNGTSFTSNSTVYTWKFGDLLLSPTDQGNYRFVQWEDDELSTELAPRERVVTVSNSNHSVTATFCGIWDAVCTDDTDCCNDFFCGTNSNVCESRDGSPRPNDGLTPPTDDITGASSAAESTMTENNSSGMSAGGKAAITIVILVFVGILIWLYIRHRRQSKDRQDSNINGGKTVDVDHHHHPVDVVTGASASAAAGSSSPFDGENPLAAHDYDQNDDIAANNNDTTFVDTSQESSSKDDSKDTGRHSPIIDSGSDDLIDLGERNV